MKLSCILTLFATAAGAQAPSMKDLMLDLIHPAFNDILLLVNRGGPKDEREWAIARRSGLALEESGALISTRGRALNEEDWIKKAQALVLAGAVAYRAAQLKDTKALADVTEKLDASCTDCHKQYRPNVFPSALTNRGGSK